MVVDGTGTLVDSDVYRALVHNHAQLTYSAVAAWLDVHVPHAEYVCAAVGAVFVLALGLLLARLAERKSSET